jgi:MFS family permease
MDVDRALVWRYYAYRITVGNGFWLPVGVLYMQDVRGFSLDQVGFVMGAFSVAMVAAELPTGYIGDRLGRRASLVLGNVVLFAFMAAYTVVTTPEAYVALHVVWAFGWAFRSGTADAWLYELLAASDHADQYARISGRASTVQKLTEAGTAVVASAIVVHGWALPFQANAALAALGIPILLTLPRDPTTSTESDDDACPADADATDDDACPADADATDDDREFTVVDAATHLYDELGRPEIRWLVVYSALFSGFYQVARVFEQPAMADVGVPVAALGIVYAVFKLASATAVSAAGWIVETVGTRTAFVALAPLYAIAFLAVAAVPILVVPVLVLNRSLGTLMGPIRYQYVNDRVVDDGRATVLSGVSMALVLTGGVLKYLGGIAADHFGLHTALVYGALATSGLGVVLWAATSPVRPDVGLVDDERAVDDATTLDDATHSVEATNADDD